jgi:polyisoprenoid-binding protein YceI
MKKIISGIILTLLCTAAWAQQVKLMADKKLSSITYSMHHRLHDWDGVSRELNSVILTDATKTTISQVAVSVKISSFDSKNANRDSHTIEVTEGLKYPNITFSSTDIQQQGDKLLVKGVLNFHGVNRNISFEALRKKSGDKLEVTGSFPVRMTAFNIEPPTLLAIPTDDEFKISFKAVY